MFHFVNTSVVSTNQTFLPWTILQVTETEHSISDFFTASVKPRITGFDCNLLSASIGQDKFSLDEVDISLPIVPVTTSFGRYLKYSINPFCAGSPSLSDVQSSDDRTLLSICLQPIKQRTMKDKLYNDLLSFLTTSDLTIRPSEAPTIKKLLVVLRDTFWHIDGHHHAFEQRAKAIPPCLGSFTGYNRPERSRHRKRLTSNMSADCLRDFTLELSTILQLSLWERPDWIELKQTFSNLLMSLSTYVEYLTQKNKRVKSDHRSPTPVREISEHMILKFVNVSSSSPTSPFLAAIEDGLANCQPYECLQISELLPTDAVQKHRAVNALISHGLSFPCILLIYVPGSNVGNFHFAWKVSADPDVSVSDCFTQSQPVVEKIKQNLPVYHSRAMRSAMVKKFGRVTRNVKPAVLRYFYKDLTGELKIKSTSTDFILQWQISFTGDQSASDNCEQSQIDERIMQLIDMEDSDIVYDLRALNGSRRSQYDRFWDECQRFLSEDLTDAVDDRRHGLVTHLSRAISIRDFTTQVCYIYVYKHQAKQAFETSELLKPTNHAHTLSIQYIYM